MHSQPPELDIPRAVGPFRVVRLLGRGGAGAVYLGERSEHFSQRVAIKFLNLFPSSGNDDDPELEERILTALDHPGIVRLLDKGKTPEGLRYIAMEYVEGTPLDEYCDNRKLPLASRIELLIQVLNAIAYAHRHLVIHADLKPSNILVTNSGQPKLLDFGIAAMFDQKWKQAFSVETAMPQFTSGFASPEQRKGERITSASDIYSVAVVAGIVLAGAPPAESREPMSPVRTLLKLDPESQSAIAARRATSATALKNALNGDLESILDKGLRAEPETRYRSADEFAGDLAAFLEHRPVLARHGNRIYKAQKWMRRHRIAASVSALFLIAVSLSIAGVAVQAARATHQRAVAQTGLHDLVRLTGLLDGELYGSIESLPQAEEAKNVLLQATGTTLDKLAGNSEHDPVLDMELVRQYERLAKLHLGIEGPGKDRHRREAISELDRADVLLARFSASDGRVAALRQQMLSLRQTLLDK
ncbi:MAG: serine/threonine protein kinase [Acidobacteria bacterium]|nr:serine/threonine protein kinase [Acidobacteriota bacterium]